MTDYNKLEVAAKSAVNRGEEILRILEDRSAFIIFYPELADSTDIDARSFCNHLNSIRDFCQSMEMDGEFGPTIRGKIAELPKMSDEDFEFDIWHLPNFVFYLVLPMGIVAWIRRYNKLVTLKSDIREMNAKLSTALFYLKTYND